MHVCKDKESFLNCQISSFQSFWNNASSVSFRATVQRLFRLISRILPESETFSPPMIGRVGGGMTAATMAQSVVDTLPLPPLTEAAEKIITAKSRETKTRKNANYSWI